jgi:hypothetical protein
MKPLSWNEIKDRALKFSKEWQDETSEDAEAKTFWDQLFDVFGVPRRRVATFEEGVARKERGNGYIDLLWKRVLLVEHKSAGKDLDKAYSQAKGYFPHLENYDLPRYIVVCNFQKFRIYDLENNDKPPIEFALKDLVNNVRHLGFIAGFQQREFREEDPVNIKAAELMGKLHDKLKAIGYSGHELEVYLVRLVFCLFADDTTIFEDDIFENYISLRSTPDGRDLAQTLAGLFEVLNTPEEKRFSNLDEDLAAFPYVNGKLFEEQLRMASFDSEMRHMLLEACRLDWGQISPAIFGSLFQSVMNPVERRNLGAHYTSEKNIMKLIKPLFLDDLWEEFKSVKKNKNKLEEFHAKLGKLRFFDPACGCGNFLVITYREIRRLELEVLKSLFGNQLGTSLADVTFVNVDQFYGIELEEFPAQISMMAMWLIDHQMNMEASKEFGEYYRRLPLKKAANIVNGNALRLDWDTVLPKKDDNVFILGNPPFIGKKARNESQDEDLALVYGNLKNHLILDYVAAWYIKAIEFIKGTQIRCAFVSTNSITQGEQVSILWAYLLQKGMYIHFAHRTFRWTSEARGKAQVFCVIIGFGLFDIKNKTIFDYETPKSEPSLIYAKNINPFLVDAENIILTARSNPISDAPEAVFGNMPNDDGNLLFTEEEYLAFCKQEPLSKKYFKPLMSSHEFLNGEKRYCLWLKDALPNDLRSIPLIMDRIKKVKEYRLNSTRKATQVLATNPSLFGEIRQPNSTYVLIPRHSSENRRFVPFGFFSKNDIVHDSCICVPNASLYHFGILTSTMHMAWMRAVCGRLKSDYRYSNNLVYNNFPWAATPTEAQKKKVEEAAQKVLDARAKFPDATLADLYDPNTMPKDLLDAHRKLDSAVDACYRKAAFKTELERLEYLFGMYKELVKGEIKQ